MPNSDERRERLSDLGKAALGVGAAAAFFTRSQIGRELASEGVTRVRHAFLKSSEELRGQSLKSMWGHGADDIKRAVNSFKNGLDDSSAITQQIPLRKNNLVAALARRRELNLNTEKYVTQLFNKERLPEILRETVGRFAKATDEVTLRHNREIADDLTTRYSKNVAKKAHGENYDVPIFTKAFSNKLKLYYGEDNGNQIEAALMNDLASVKAYKERYAQERGNAIAEGFKEQLERFESYQTKFSQNNFWNTLVGQQSATVQDILNHKEQFTNQKLGDTSVINLLEEMVQQDERFAQLVVDPALKIKEDKFYNYQALGKTLEDFEDGFLNNIGRILKPLEVRRHIRNSPDFFYIQKGAIDAQLKAIAEPDNPNNALDNGYLRLFDKTYRVNNNGALEHIADLDDAYLTPSKGFEGQQMRHMSGNTDYNLDDNSSSIIKQKLGLVGKVSKDYDKRVNRFVYKNKVLQKLGLAEEVDLPNSYDNIILGLSNNNQNIYENVRNLIEDLDASEDAYLPSRQAIEKIGNSGTMVRVKDRMQKLLGSDESLLDYLGNLNAENSKTDIGALARLYQKNPIEALDKTYYHGSQKNNFIEEVRRELFKNAVYASDMYNDLGHFMGEVEKLGISHQDLQRIKNLTYTSYLQQSTGMSLKNPEAILDSNIEVVNENLTKLFMSQENGDMQQLFKQTAEDNAQRRLAMAYENQFLQQHVSVADRPSPYVHMRKGITVLDIIEELNNGILEATKKTFDFANQFVAGRNNLQDVTTHTLYPYFGLFRLQNDVKKVGLNLGRDYTGNVLDLAKGIFSKRAMPVYAIGFAASYLNYESENFFGQSFTNMAAEATAKIDLGVRRVADTLGLSNGLKDAYYWFSPLNYLQEEAYQTAEERKAYYESGMSPVKQSKFWALGSSEFFGGRVLYYEPNYVKRTQVNWRDIGVYGSSDEKWAHSLIPTPRHPLSTIRYLTNPYWLEEKHKLDRPYMVSGPMFDPNTPWGTIGNLTIGNLIKPQKRLNQEYVTSKGVDVRNIIEAENARIKDQARSSGTLVIKSSDTALENTQPTYGDAYSSNQKSGAMAVTRSARGIGGYVTKREYIESNLNLLDKIQVFAASVQTGRDRILNQIERMNYAIKEKGKWSYGNDTQFATDIYNAKPKNDATLIQDRHVAADLRNLTSNEDMLQDLSYSIGQMSGVYNFLTESLLPSSKRYAYARSSDMYAKSNRFWESGIDGAEYGGIMEIVRRFIPHEDRNRIRVNPLRNNMPSWLPARFKIGDPYAQIKKGEMRLPGKGYEALYGLEDKSDFMINSDFVGLDAQSIINHTITSNNSDSELTNAYQQSLLASGMAIAINKGVYDKSNNVSGTYDALIRDETSASGQAVMQIKAVDEAHYNSIIQNGANRQDLANVNYYLGQEDLDKGYVTYINKKTKAMTTFDVNFSEAVYQASQQAVRQARKTLTDNVTKGVLSPYELYDDMTRFKILADVAPGSAEYKQYKKLVQSNLATPSQKQEYEAILKRVERQSQKHRFFNYKFTNVNIDKQKGVIESISGDQIKLVGDETTYRLAGLKNYNQKIYDYLAPGMKVQLEFEKNYAHSKYIQAAVYANGLNVNRQMMREGAAERNDDGTAMSTRALLTKNQILLGAPFEMLSHMPIPILHNKFLKMDSPYESWMRENIYGTKFSSWNHPIQTILKPSMQQAWGSSLTQGLLGAGLFALNEYVSDINLTKGQKNAIRLAHTLFTPGAFAGDIVERVATLNTSRKTSGTGARIGSLIGLTGMAFAHAQNPLIATASGAGIGAILGSWLESGMGAKGSLVGAAAGLAVSAYKTDGFKFSEINSAYIPKDVKKRWEIEEYFDRLEYLKYKGLYEKAARLALSEEGVPIDKILSDLEKKEKRSDSALSRLNIARDNIAHSDLSSQAKYDLLNKIDSEIQAYANPNIEVPATPYVRLAMGYRQAMQSTVYG